jgi:hypothetical protein
LLIVADQSAVLEDPGEGALAYPAPRQHLEALGVRAATDDLERDVCLVGGPVHETASVAAIGEDAGDEGEALARCLKRQLAAVAVLDIGTVNADGEEPTIGVRQDVALASGDLLARVIALVAPF